MPIEGKALTGTPDPAGNAIDVTVVATSQGNVERQAVSLSDPTDPNARAAVLNGAPAAAAYGSVARVLLYDANGNPLALTGGGDLPVDASGSVVSVSNFPATQPVSAAALPLPAGASTEATLALIKAKTDNLDAALSTRTKPADDQVVQGDVAHNVADGGNPVKVGGKVLANASALPAAVADGRRVDLLADEFGRRRILVNRPKILGSYYFHSGRLTILAAAHAATAGFFWIVNPVGSAVVVYVKHLRAQLSSTAATAFASAPRVTAERVTFTGSPSGATIAYALRDLNDAAAVSSVRTASTGLTLTAGAIVAGWVVPCVMTAVGISVPIEQLTVDAHDDDDLIVLRAGQGLVIRQPDAGTASDTRLLTVDGQVEER